MTEKKAFILCCAAFSILLSGAVVADIVHRMEPDAYRDTLADRFYFITDAIFKLSLPATIWIFLRDLKIRLLAAFFSFLTYMAIGNLFDELFAEDPTISSPYEYAWAIVGFIGAIFQYHLFYPLATIWRYLKRKILNLWRNSNG